MFEVYHGKKYIEGFRNVLRRLTADSNRDRYNAICTQPCNKDEVRICSLCKKIWPKDYGDRNSNINEYVAYEGLEDFMAKEYLEEINVLLDKLGWEKE